MGSPSLNWKTQPSAPSQNPNTSTVLPTSGMPATLCLHCHEQCHARPLMAPHPGAAQHRHAGPAATDPLPDGVILQDGDGRCPCYQ